MMTSRAELVRKLQVGTKLKIVDSRYNPSAIGKICTITKVQTQDIVFEPTSPSGQRSWQAIPPVGSLRFTERGFAIHDYARKNNRYTVVPDGIQLIVYEFVE